MYFRVQTIQEKPWPIKKALSLSEGLRLYLKPLLMQQASTSGQVLPKGPSQRAPNSKPWTWLEVLQLLLMVTHNKVDDGLMVFQRQSLGDCQNNVPLKIKAQQMQHGTFWHTFSFVAVLENWLQTLLVINSNSCQRSYAPGQRASPSQHPFAPK